MDRYVKEMIFHTATKYFALISSVFYQKETEKISNKLIKYLKTFNKNLDYNSLKEAFEEDYRFFTNETILFEDEELGYQSFLSSFDGHFSESVFKYGLQERMLITLILLDLFYIFFPEKKDEIKLVELIAKRLGITTGEFCDFSTFVNRDERGFEDNKNILVFKPLSEKVNDLEGSWIDKNKPEELKKSNLIEDERLNCFIYVLFIERLKLFVVTCSEAQDVKIENVNLATEKFTILVPGGQIIYKDKAFINYIGVKTCFLKNNSTDISFLAENIHYARKKENVKLKGFNAFEDSGKLIGILGKEGVGKSTLLEVLAGRISPTFGKVVINGYDLSTDKYLLKNFIGFVPEQDMLFDELSVYDNLFLTARFFYSNLSSKEIEKKVNRLLEEIELYDVRHKITGSVFDKNIQPGQRRLLNIALELIREPKFLLVDNAVYGLGTIETSKILKILNSYTFGGNIVITTLTQTSIQAFNLFDKLWILDEDGYPAYNGETTNAPGYFKNVLKIEGLSDSVKECTPEYILDLVNYKVPGALRNNGKRKILPQDWHKIYLENITFTNEPEQVKLPLPSNFIKIPSLETQLKLFSIRNFKIKFSNTQKIIFLILAGPFFGFFLSFLLKESHLTQYTFSTNANIPMFLFFAVIISLIFGLFMSSKEIIRERNIHYKEEYLEFSHFSYINSKIIYLFIIGAFQTFLFALTSTGILGIKGFLLSFWLILYSVCCCGILFGLILSTIHSNLKNIYEKSIPIFLALQILLGGGLVPYRDLNLNEGSYTPILSELMVSKWAYEALLVEQYKKNEYGKYTYNYDNPLSHATFYTNHLIPELQKYTDRISEGNTGSDSLIYYLRLLKNGINTVLEDGHVFPFEYAEKLNPEDFSEEILNETKDYLTYIDLFYFNRFEELIRIREDRISALRDSLSPAVFDKMIDDYNNFSIEKLVTNKDEPAPWIINNGKIVQLSDPIFQYPKSNFGRSILFLPEKKLRGEIFDTFWFNTTVIWFFSLFFYVILIINLPETVNGLSTLRLFYKENEIY